jgi:hypothetical protein
MNNCYRQACHVFYEMVCASVSWWIETGLRELVKQIYYRMEVLYQVLLGQVLHLGW